MKRTCETCAAYYYESEKKSDGGQWMTKSQCRLTLANGPDVYPYDFCLQWTPRERGTCGECEWFFDDGEDVFCLKSSDTSRTKNTVFEPSGMPGCGDWMPKREVNDD